MYRNYEKIRKEKGLKNADISRMTGISNSTLSEWKSGKHSMKTESLIRIAECLGVSIEYLVTGKEYDDPQRLDPDTAAAAAAISGDMTMMMIVSVSSKLNQEGKNKVLAYTKDLFASGLYIYSAEDASA